MRNACFFFLRPTILASKILTQTKFLLRRLPGNLLERFYVDCMRHWLILGRLQGQAGAKMGSKIDQAAPKWYQSLRRGPSWTCSWKIIGFLMHFGWHLGYWWFPFGSNWPIVASLLVSSLWACSKVSRHLTSSLAGLNMCFFIVTSASFLFLILIVRLLVATLIESFSKTSCGKAATFFLSLCQS